MKTWATSLVAVIIAAMLCVVVLIPVVSENQVRTDAVQSSEAYTSFASTELGKTYEFSSEGITVDGELLPLSVSNLISDRFKIVYYHGNTTLCDKDGGNVLITSFTTNRDGSYSYVTSGGSRDGASPMEWFIGPAAEGDYVYAYNQSAPLHFNAGAEIYLLSNVTLSDGSNTLSNLAHILVYRGAYSDIMTLTGAYLRSATDYVTSSGTITLNDVSYQDGCYSVPGAKYGTTVAGDFSGVGGSAMFAPYHYTYLDSKDDALNALINLVPLMILAGLVISVVGTFLLRRD